MQNSTTPQVVTAPEGLVDLLKHSIANTSVTANIVEAHSRLCMRARSLNLPRCVLVHVIFPSYCSHLETEETKAQKSEVTRSRSPT